MCCIFALACVLIVCVPNALGIKCYRCFLAEHPYYVDDKTQVKTCKNFDYSESYIVECPDSTFCYKKTVKDHFYKTEYVREERGCAQQVYRGQKFDDRSGWSKDTYVVRNAYQVGCKRAESYGLKGLNVEECYCDSYDLCNSSLKLKTVNFLVIFVSFVVCLLNK